MVDDATLEILYKKIKTKNIVLFVGDDAHSPLLPTMAQLADELIDEFRLPGLPRGTSSFSHVAQVVDQRRGYMDLLDHIRGRIKTAPDDSEIKPGRLHELIRDLGFQRIITTGFDDLIFKAYGNQVKQILRFVPDTGMAWDPENNEDDQTVLIAWYGHFLHPKKLVITTKDHYQFRQDFKKRSGEIENWFKRFPFLFIGCNFGDRNFDALDMYIYDLYQTYPDARQRMQYIAHSTANSSYAISWSERITIINEDPETLLEKIYNLGNPPAGYISPTPVPPPPSPPPSTSPGIPTPNRPIYVRPPDTVIWPTEDRKPPRALTRSPFKTLWSYTEEDGDIFFGRGSFINKVMAQLESRPVVVLAGEHNVGMTSVLRAGVFYHVLNQAPKRYQPFYINCQGGGHPMPSVKKAIQEGLPVMWSAIDQQFDWRKRNLEKLQALVETDSLVDPFPDLLDSLTTCVHATFGQAVKPLLLFDHFHEVLATLDKNSSTDFLERLYRIISLESGRAAKIVLAIQGSDPHAAFRQWWRVLDRVGQGFLESILRYRVHLLHLEMDDARSVMEEQARVGGFSYETSAIDLLLEDLGKNERVISASDLQVACSMLYTHVVWDEQRTEITAEDYEWWRKQPPPDDEFVVSLEESDATPDQEDIIFLPTSAQDVDEEFEAMDSIQLSLEVIQSRWEEVLDEVAELDAERAEELSDYGQPLDYDGARRTLVVQMQMPRAVYIDWLTDGHRDDSLSVLSIGLLKAFGSGIKVQFTSEDEGSTLPSAGIVADEVAPLMQIVEDDDDIIFLGS
jgi:hypothetical protein